MRFWFSPSATSCPPVSLWRIWWTLVRVQLYRLLKEQQPRFGGLIVGAEFIVYGHGMSVSIVTKHPVKQTTAHVTCVDVVDDTPLHKIRVKYVRAIPSMAATNPVIHIGHYQKWLRLTQKWILDISIIWRSGSEDHTTNISHCQNQLGGVFRHSYGAVCPIARWRTQTLGTAHVRPPWRHRQRCSARCLMTYHVVGPAVRPSKLPPSSSLAHTHGILWWW